MKHAALTRGRASASMPTGVDERHRRGVDTSHQHGASRYRCLLGESYSLAR